MGCRGRSPQAISLKFLPDRWNCLETIMQCLGRFFPLSPPPNSDFKSDSVSVFHSHSPQERELCVLESVWFGFAVLHSSLGSKAKSQKLNLGITEQVFQEGKNSRGKILLFLYLVWVFFLIFN